MADFITSAQEIFEEHTYAVLGAVLVVAAILIMAFAHYMGWFGGKKARSTGPLDNEEEFNSLIESIHEKQKPRKK